MKNITAFIFGAILLTAGCTDEVLQKNDVEKNISNEVSFIASVEKNAVTRTYFSNDAVTNEDGTFYQLFWSSDDRIVVGSPMALSDRNWSVYNITVPNAPNSDQPGYGSGTHASSITLDTSVKPYGVQWDSNKDKEKGQFYAIYPYRAETLRRPAALGYLEKYHNQLYVPSVSNDTSAMARALVEPDQRIWAPEGTDVDETTKLLNMHGSNHANVMWAMTTDVTNGETVNLRFIPLSTCLMMTFKNGVSPDDAPGTAEDAMIEEIQIVAPAGTVIAGEMNIKFPDIAHGDGSKQIANGGNATCDSVPGSSWNSNVVTIHPWIQSYLLDEDGKSIGTENGIHPTLKPGDTMLVEAFLLPTAEFNVTDEWKIKVKINGKVYERPLLANVSLAEGQNQTLKPGQIHKIDYPAFFVDYEWYYDPASWMNDIPDATYLTQLTLPGSWYSYCQDQDIKTDYQSLNLANQIAKGVRAFDISTRIGYDADDTENANKTIVISGSRKTADNPSDVGGSYDNAVSVQKAITQIVNAVTSQNTTNTTVKGRKPETAVIVIGIEAGTGKGLGATERVEWLTLLNNAINGLDKDVLNHIYGYGTTAGKEITAETTLGDVRGNVILKINIDASNNYINKVPTSSTFSTIKGLISFGTYNWLTKLYYYDEDNKVNVYDPGNLAETSLTTELHWAEWNNGWNATQIVGTATDREGIFAFNWSCTNRTCPPDGTELAETNQDYIPTEAKRQAALEVLKNESIDVYKAGYHDEWFMFGFGGAYAASANITATVNPLSFTEAWNTDYVLPLIKDYFKNRTPCPMGIVFVNQIGNSNSKYSGDQILSNLIKMNGAFFLQQNPTWTSPMSSQKPAAALTNSMRSKAATQTYNGWTVY